MENKEPQKLNLQRLLALADESQLIDFFQDVKEMFRYAEANKLDIDQLCTNPYQLDVFIVNSIPAFARFQNHPSLFLQKEALESLLCTIVVCRKRFIELADNPDIFNMLIVGLYYLRTKFPTQEHRQQTYTIIMQLIKDLRYAAKSMGYTVGKEKTNNCYIIENNIQLQLDRRQKFIKNNKQLQHELVAEGTAGQEPLLVLESIFVGLRRQCCFSEQISYFVNHHALTVRDIALAVTQSKQADLAVVTELKRLFSKIVPPFEFNRTGQAVDQDTGEIVILNEVMTVPGVFDTLERHCLRLYQCLAAIVNALIVTTSVCFLKESPEYLASQNYCLVMLSRFYQVFSKREALEDVIISVLESIVSSKDKSPEVLRNGALFLFYILNEEKLSSESFVEKIEANETLNLFKDCKYFSPDYSLADLDDQFQISNEHEPSAGERNDSVINISKIGMPAMVEIVAGDTHREIYEVLVPNSLLVVEFTVQERDITFQVEKLERIKQAQTGDLKEEGNQLIYQVEKTQSLCKIFEFKEPGLYKITFFNDYSWVRGKVVSYRSVLLVPRLEPSGKSPQSIDEFNAKYLSIYKSLQSHEGIEERKELPIDDIDPQSFTIEREFDENICTRVSVRFNFKQPGTKTQRSFDANGLLFGYSKAMLQQKALQDDQIVHYIYLKKGEAILPQIVQYLSPQGEVKAILNADAMVWNGDKDQLRDQAMLQYIEFLEQFKYSGEGRVHRLNVQDDETVRSAVVSALKNFN